MTIRDKLKANPAFQNWTFGLLSDGQGDHVAPSTPSFSNIQQCEPATGQLTTQDLARDELHEAVNPVDNPPYNRSDYLAIISLLGCQTTDDSGTVRVCEHLEVEHMSHWCAHPSHEKWQFLRCLAVCPETGNMVDEIFFTGQADDPPADDNPGGLPGHNVVPFNPGMFETLGCTDCAGQIDGWCLLAKPGSRVNIACLSECPRSHDPIGIMATN